MSRLGLAPADALELTGVTVDGGGDAGSPHAWVLRLLPPHLYVNIRLERVR